MNRPQMALARQLWCTALLVGLPGWWAVLWIWPATTAWFMPSTMSTEALLAFALPDAACTIAGCVSLLWMGTEDRPRTWFGLAGAHAYSGLWVLAATLLTGEAWAGAFLMCATAAITLTLAWTDQPESAWFRESEDAPTAIHVAKTVAHAVLFDGVFLVLLPVLLLWAGRDLHVPALPTTSTFWPLLAVVVLLNLGGLGSGIWMAVNGRGTPLPTDTAADLVVSGPYRWVRNPMAALGILQGILLGIGLGSLLIIVYALIGAVLWHVFVRPIEERDLEARFGDAYVTYKNEVRLWLPGIGPR